MPLRLTLLAWLAAVPLAAAVYQAPSPEPTPEETLILELMNRFRADPVGEADRLSDAGGKPAGIPADVDWAMFLEEMRSLEPSQPLVFDLAALKSARWHSYYMIHNGLGHDEKEGKEGFTGERFSERMKKAGFDGRPGGENAYRDARSPFASHIGFIVDFGPGGPGGMQKGRGHRMNMIKAGFNVVGPGAVPHDGRLSVTHNLGSRSGRFAGGVIYRDQNGNDFYDVGEGIGGVTIRASGGSAPAMTWASGAFTLELPGSSAGTLRAEYHGLSYDLAYPASSDNVHFTWAVPAQADLDLADKILAEAEDLDGDPSENDRTFRALVDIYEATRHLTLDSERQQRIDQLVEPIVAELEAHREAARTALADLDPKALKAALKEPSKRYRRTIAEDWFEEIEMVARATAAVQGLERMAAAGKDINRRDHQKLMESLDQAATSLKTAEWRRHMVGLKGRAGSVQLP